MDTEKKYTDGCKSEVIKVLGKSKMHVIFNTVTEVWWEEIFLFESHGNIFGQITYYSFKITLKLSRHRRDHWGLIENRFAYVRPQKIKE